MIRSSSAAYNTLPPSGFGPKKIPSMTNVSHAPISSDSPINASSLKRRRGSGVTDLQVPSKQARTSHAQTDPAVARGHSSPYGGFPHSAGAGHVTNSQHMHSAISSKQVEEYMRRHPVTHAIPAEDQELFCICLEPEDGKPKIECANGRDCLRRWYHLECIGLKEDDLPNEDGKSYDSHILIHLTDYRRVVLW